MIVIGIDPGLAATGYGIVRKTGNEFECLDYGCVTTKPGEETPVRLRILHEAIASVIDRWAPDLVVMEDLFAKAAAPSAAISIGQVRGVFLLAAGQRGCSVEGLAPRTVKVAVTGSGTADKSQIERTLRRLLGVSKEIKPDHAADALAIAYVGAMRGKDGGRTG